MTNSARLEAAEPTSSPTPTHSLDDLLGRFVNDLGATVSAGNVVIGDRSGLYRALAEAGPLTSAELAAYTGTAERYVREWLRRPGRRRLRHLRAGDRPVLADRGAGAGLRRPGRAGAARRVPARVGLSGRSPGHRGVVPHRPGRRLGRAPPRRLHRLRAVLPARLRREPGAAAWIPADHRPRRPTRRRHHGGRRRLRARLLDPDPGRDLPGVEQSPVRPHPGSIELARRMTHEPGWRTGAASRWRRRRTFPAADTAWSPRSTACTTWATRSARPGTSGTRSPTTASG